MNRNQQQAYDRGSTIFSPDGRLYQVEYAREAVKRGSTVAGVRAENGVVLAARRLVRSSLQVPESVEKLHRAAGHLGVASAGHAADARRLVDFGRQAAQRERLRYGEPMGVEELARALADHVQESTQAAGSRPYGAALLVGGVDPVGGGAGDDGGGAGGDGGGGVGGGGVGGGGDGGDGGVGEPRLFETDPSGTPTEWLATAIGERGEAVREHLDEAYHPEISVDEGVDLAVEALADGHEDEGFEVAELAVGTIGVADGTFVELDAGEKRGRLEELGLLESAS